MGQASDTYAQIVREQYDDWKTRYYPKQQQLMQMATNGALMNQQLNRVEANSEQSLRGATMGMQNQLGRFGVEQTQNASDNSLSLRSALATAGAKNGIREAEQDRQMNILTGGNATLRQQMNIGGGNT